MKVLLDIKDSKAIHFMEILNNLPYVKAEQLTDGKALLFSEIRESVVEMKLVKEGKKKARDAQDFINELKSKNN